jgi:tRNA modification GTPase
MEKLLRNGITLAIIGKPNAGKSSLLNAILKEERAIVTDIEGTTRDTIEELIQIDGIPVKIIDTAGIRETDNEIEKIGIKKSLEIAQKADLVIAIIDASKILEEEDREIFKLLEGKKGIVLLNKVDKNIVLREKEIEKEVGNRTVISISALNKIGIDKIYETISKMYKFNEISIDDSFQVTNERHKQAIRNMLVHITNAKEAIEKQMPIDVVTISITDILEEIGKITGESVSEDIISEIFKKFCLGK